MEAAIDRMAAEGKTGIDVTLAMDVAVKIEELMREHPFMEARRLAVNEISFRQRRACVSIMGSYFGAHGGYAAAQNKATEKQSRQGKLGF